MKLVSRIKVITHPPGSSWRSRPRPRSAPPVATRGRRPLDAACGSWPSARRRAGPAALVECSALSRRLPAADPPRPPHRRALRRGLRRVARRHSRRCASPTARRRAGRSLRGPAWRHGASRPPPGRCPRGGSVSPTDPPRHSCRPSVDVLFESLAREYGRSAVACLLTGWDATAPAGLLAIRRAGGLTIAQDESTSVVYGMPREAATPRRRGACAAPCDPSAVCSRRCARAGNGGAS